MDVELQQTVDDWMREHHYSAARPIIKRLVNEIRKQDETLCLMAEENQRLTDLIDSI